MLLKHARLTGRLGTIALHDNYGVREMAVLGYTGPNHQKCEHCGSLYFTILVLPQVMDIHEVLYHQLWLSVLDLASVLSMGKSIRFRRLDQGVAET